MRTGFTTIQQTLTAESITVLNNSVAEAGRRNHGQTTPLHVAATLLSSPSGFLRHACIKSHPNSSHPLQCRALELCFSVALERLPTAINLSPGLEPPISNALMAALKRAQAHQRRGCPEQQQQPLLAVKVELEQLVISILDDPSVSRVMREARFSSPAVKSTIEQSLGSLNALPGISTSIGLRFRSPTPAIPSANLYLNPLLQQQSNGIQSGYQRNEELNRVVDILLRNKKRNPVLVGDSEPEIILKELLRRIENKEIVEEPLKNTEVIHLENVIQLEKNHVSDKSQFFSKIKELVGLIEAQMSNIGGVILNLGDLKWLVEQQSVSLGIQQQQMTSDAGRAVVVEMGKLLDKFAECGEGLPRLWLIGTATCETYLRCQVYHPSMENCWDLQAMAIAARSPLSGMLPRLGNNGLLCSSVKSSPVLKGFQTTSGLTSPIPENFGRGQTTSCCPQCLQNYERELEELEKIDESENVRPPLPQWLHNAKIIDEHASTLDSQIKDKEVRVKQKSLELRKKWDEICMCLHPNFHQQRVFSNCDKTLPSFSKTDLYNPNLLLYKSFQPNVQPNQTLADTLRLRSNAALSQPPDDIMSPPQNPVETELVLGHPKVTQDFLQCNPREPQIQSLEHNNNRNFSLLDADSFKKLLRSLMEKVWWQTEAASAVATIVTECKLGNGKYRGGKSKGDIWLLFTGPDRVGKKKMVYAMSEMICGTHPVVVSLGSHRDETDSNSNFRGKTVLDRIAEAVKENPFSVIMLDDIDQADMLVKGSIKRAMDRGRLSDTYGREISLGNVIFVLTTNIAASTDETKLTKLADREWQLKMCIQEKTGKRRSGLLFDKERFTKPRKESESYLAFDLNETADSEDNDKADGSNNSSDLTTDREEENGFVNCRLSSSTTSSASHELQNFVDDTILFKPVDFGPFRQKINTIIRRKLLTIWDSRSFEVDDEALDKIVGGVWLGRTGIEEWMEKVVVPNVNELKSRVVDSDGDSRVVRLEVDHSSYGGCRSNGDLLPSSINI